MVGERETSIDEPFVLNGGGGGGGIWPREETTLDTICYMATT